MGNPYGVAWSAEPDAKAMLNTITAERWNYYLNNVFPSDSRVFMKLLSEKPRERFIALVKQYSLKNSDFKNKTVQQLVEAADEAKAPKVAALAAKLHEEYYGKA